MASAGPRHSKDSTKDVTISDVASILKSGFFLVTGWYCAVLQINFLYRKLQFYSFLLYLPYSTTILAEICMQTHPRSELNVGLGNLLDARPI